MAAGTDSNDANGAALTIASHDRGGPLRLNCRPRPLRNYARLLAWVDPGFWRDAEAGAASRNVVVRVGQGMYTPEDGTRTDLVTDDRPYAGLLYAGVAWNRRLRPTRSEEHTSELQSLMRNSYAVFCLKKKKKQNMQPSQRKQK